MFKPIQRTAPGVFTNAQRKRMSWGLNFDRAVNSINAKLTMLPLMWGYNRPTDFYTSIDFAGENDNEGYAPEAPEMVTVKISKGSGSNYVNITFTFNGTATNGGIAPADLQIENFVGDGQSMADLYPGAIIYEWNYSGGYYEPRQIITGNQKIGSNKSLTVPSISLSSVSNGAEAVVVPVYCKTPRIGGVSASSLSEKVLLAHNSWATYTISGSLLGTILFSNILAANKAYFSSGTNWGNSTGPFVFTPGVRSLRLVPTSSYNTEIVNKDKRLAITMTLLKQNNSYGLGDYCPVTFGDGENGELYTLQDYQYLYHDYSYPICAWSDVDGDPAYLMLRYRAVNKATPDWGIDGLGSSAWSMVFVREIVLLDGNGDVISGQTIFPGGWTTIVVSKPGNGSVSVKGADGGRFLGIRKFRVSNIMSGDEHPVGVSVRIYGEDDNYTDWQFNSGGSSIYIISPDEYSPIDFNTAPDKTNYYKIPVQTSMYIDLTVDTMETAVDIDHTIK